MARGKKYTKEEWDAALSLRKMGKGWPEISKILDRGENGRCAEIFRKYKSYEEYSEAVSKRKGKRTTEQLQFLPPELSKTPKKIHVKSEPSQDELTAYKLRLARKQAIAVNHFISELRDAGFRF